MFPQPQKVELFEEKGISNNSLRQIFLNGDITKPVLFDALRSLPQSQKQGNGVLTLTLSKDKNVPQSLERLSDYS